MATIKTVLRKKKLSDGSYPVCLRITKNRKSKYFSTIFKAMPYEWNDNTGDFRKNAENYIQSNRLLLKLKSEAFKIYTNLEIENNNFSLDDFENCFRLEKNPIQNNVFNFWSEITDEMNTAGRTGNARVYKDVMHVVKLYHRSHHLTFKDITPAFLNKFEVFCRARGGTDGGIGIKMRGIRAIYNFAIQRNIAREEDYPFKDYKISKLKGKGLKKALSFPQVMEIIKMDLNEYPHLTQSRNYFAFSFYTRGMNFADMLGLEWKNVTEDRIFYTRSKTKGNFTIKILPPVREILDYYKERSLDTKYVFPILLSDNLTPAQIANRKHKTLQRYNKELKEIAQICNIDKPLTSYVARHSYANCLKQKGVATDVISESMGHQNLAITQAYLKELDNTVLDDASELLLAT
ncbi:site-specific integrase [Christiangramia sp. SM2212]|uniref:Site-specific integrase n=1 Tax=Christiangramia sediminicola TaxID=3073267 RepID=A0ABU1ESE2_9FLAO|nr:site-specific integrase [Christiangramia sp. SM2212]MDR5591319.1 site-specific integrase [Christiangramia sp. SM2212]